MCTAHARFILKANVFMINLTNCYCDYSCIQYLDLPKLKLNEMMPPGLSDILYCVFWAKYSAISTKTLLWWRIEVQY